MDIIDLAGLLILRDAVHTPPTQPQVVVTPPSEWYVTDDWFADDWFAEPPYRANFSSAPVETPDDRREKRFAGKNVLALARDYLALSPVNGWREAFLARIKDKGKRQAVLKAAQHLEAAGL